jgi:serine/threonine protein kinase
VLHENFHQNNFVHGDIKPQNILLTKSGPELIDDLKLRNREISFLATPGWGAPEQIMTRPVSFSSDIYSLGLILTSLIHGTLTGELTYNVLASRSGSVRISPMIKDPKVYLTPDNTIIEGKGALRWMELIETCLRFDLSNRFRDAKEFTTELAILNKDYPLHGIMETRFSRGDLTIIESALFDKSHCHIITNGNNFLIPMDLDDCTGD